MKYNSPVSSLAEFSDDHWKALERATDQLVSSWNGDTTPNIPEIPPPYDWGVRGRILIELIKIDQEYCWRSGQPRYVEDYLEQRRFRHLAEDPVAVRELIEAECENRGVHQRFPEQTELDSRFGSTARDVDLDKVKRNVSKEQLESVDPANLPLRADQAFGRYEIKELLGCGGMGHVYRAHDLELKRDIALKCPAPDAQERTVKLFLEEARTLAQIDDSSGVCPVYDVGTINGKSYMTMKLIKGQTLADRIKRNPLLPREAITIVTSLCRALSEVHGSNIVHRDIKPGNVMIEHSGQPVLMDFGLAHRSQRPHDTAGGTLAYMSPEQMRGDDADARSDIYSMGVLLYQTLTGSLPFTGSLTHVIHGVEHADPVDPREVQAGLPAPLAAICLKAMAKHPDDRYQTASEMADALEMCQPLLQHHARFFSTRRRVAIGTCVVLLTAIVLLMTGEGTLAVTFEGVGPEAKVTVNDTVIQLKDGQAEFSVPVWENFAIRVAGYPTHQLDVRIRWRGDRRVAVVKLAPSGMQISPLSQHAFPDSVWPIAVSRDTEVLYAGMRLADEQDEIASFHIQPWRELAPVPFSPEATKVSYKSMLVLGDYLYLTDYYAPGLTRVNLRSNSHSILQLSKGEDTFIHTVRATPDEKRLLVLGGMDSNPKNAPDERLHVVDIAQERFSLQQTLELDDEPSGHSIAFTSDSRFAYIVTRGYDSRASKLHRVQLARKCVIAKSVDLLGKHPTGVAISNARKRVFVADRTVRKLRAYDADTLVRIPSDDIEIDNWSPEYFEMYEPANLLAVTVKGGPLLLVNLETGRLTHRVADIFGTQKGLVFSKDGRRLFLSHGAPKTLLSVVDTSPMLATLCFSSDRRTANTDMYAASASGEFTRRLIGDNSDCDTAPTWSHDGRCVAFISDRKAAENSIVNEPHVCVLDVATGDSQPYDSATVSTRVPTHLAWSPDDDQIAFVESTGTSVRLLDVRSHTVSTLLGVNDVPHSSAGEYDLFGGLSWSSNGDEFYFDVRRAADAWVHDVFRLDVKTKTLRSLTDRYEGILADPDVSPDGRYVAMVRQLPETEPTTFHIVVTKADGSDLKRVDTGTCAHCATPCWWPDGKSIVFTALDTDLNRKVYRVEIATGEVQQLTSGPGTDTFPDVHTGWVLPGEAGPPIADMSIGIGEK